MSKTYTWAEVNQHNTRDSLWFVYKGKVLDVTSFLDEHPGGDEIIVEHGGKDGSQEFDDIGHSREAYDMLNKYVIGTVEGAESAPEIKAKAPAKAATRERSPDKPQSSSSLALNILVAIIVAGIAYFVASTMQ
eukprot:TRINITY_DN169_c0_g4_i1.p1 TRINITY_DN169_c0_g4~~TRINITY_DN169_c0_g4_i1.p1  ORF type:complete len:133 (-),score=32.87 TRINITY_DN169_c0_g4_i1:230-628(-)